MSKSQSACRCVIYTNMSYKGRGSASLRVYGYSTWKEFFHGEDPLTQKEIEEASSALKCNADGEILVCWPLVSFEFLIDQFTGEAARIC